MHGIRVGTLLVLLTISHGFCQSVAWQRANRLGLGVNLSFLEQYWQGTKANHFGDFLKPDQVAARKQAMADIAKAGFKTVRIPVCFGAWASVQPPYRWDYPASLTAPDSLIRWALDNKLTAIVDLHHVEFDGSVGGADTTARVVWLWQQIARRYKDTNPDNVLFELRNEPHSMTAAAWRAQAALLIETVRAIAPAHTIVVGFHDWNGRDALIQSAPFSDPNIIYTFHFYDPFVFTHQGATWAGPGLSDLRGVPFPASAATSIPVPASARGTWVEGAINNYKNEATYDAIAKSLAAAKTWSVTNNVPIFLGEFGSYSQNADSDSRCRHAEAIYVALGKLGIPSAWWEWDSGFSMFSPGTNQLMPCMKEALTSSATGQLKALGVEPQPTPTLRIFPNPGQDLLRIETEGSVPAQADITDQQGRLLLHSSSVQAGVSISPLQAGIYWLRVYDKNGKLIGVKSFIK